VGAHALPRRDGVHALGLIQDAVVGGRRLGPFQLVLSLALAVGKVVIRHHHVF
jgi:hypothetical protein